MSRIAKHLLPDTAVENKLGRLEIGSCDLVELAEKFGTPVLFMTKIIFVLVVEKR